MVVGFAGVMPEANTRRVSLLLFGSGFSALVYQLVWTREFRLIFGGSTSATAAVLAIFTLGLGLGALVFGPRLDRSQRPLRAYAGIEAGVALSAAASPFLLAVVRWAYLSLGGSVTLGAAGGTLARLALAAMVLAVPTFLMGATLPAAARAVTADADTGRRGVAWLYGINTLGAVSGAALATFVVLERLGDLRTLLAAAALNLVVAAAAFWLARAEPAGSLASGPESEEAAATLRGGDETPRSRVYVAAFLVGLVFFLMELVWYRMLGPILGGSVFTFGLILSLALLGIGLGGSAYAIAARHLRPTLSLFSWTCLAEAFFILLPHALGDRLAFAAAVLRGFSALGFPGLVLGWTAVAGAAVVPAAVVAGFQFPLLMALLGSGRRRIAHDVSRAYVWNMAGGIAGSLLGGFGLLPLLTAPTTWQLSGAALIALAVASLWGRPGPARPAVWTAACLVTLLLAADGPSVAWRHSGIGVGRAGTERLRTAQDLAAWRQGQRRSVLWEADGVESSVALKAAGGVAFVVNGKIDGHATRDAPTQVMAGLLGAALHTAPRSAMVIGLGTGSTAGWLAAVPAIERVDVSELEPRILDVARALADVNESALASPKLHVTTGDARELLQTVRRQYDLVVSEPSNPYRAGIATLFSREFYAAVRARLAPGGLFVQWLQAYEIDETTLCQVFATLRAEFPGVTVFRTHRDLLLVGSGAPLSFDAALRQRLGQEPLRRALEVAWETDRWTGFLARYVGGDPLSRALAARARVLVRDDRNPLEFGFARSLERGDVRIVDLRREALALGDRWPSGLELTAQEREEAEDQMVDLYEDPGLVPEMSGPRRRSAEALAAAAQGGLGCASGLWADPAIVPRTLRQRLIAAEVLAERGDPRAATLAASLPPSRAADGAAVLTRLFLRQGNVAAALPAALAALDRHHRSPWVSVPAFSRFLSLLPEIARARPGAAAPIAASLAIPFAGGSLFEERMTTWLRIADEGPDIDCRAPLQYFERAAPPAREYQELRQRCLARGAGPPSR